MQGLRCTSTNMPHNTTTVIANEKTQQPKLTVHNYSAYQLSTEELSLLHNFSPTPVISLEELQSQMLRHFNDFAKSLRLKYSCAQCRKKSRKLTKPLPPTSMATIHRQIKFLPLTNPDTVVTRYLGLSKVENYIDNTKQSIVNNLTDIAKTSTFNLTAMQGVAIQQLKKSDTQSQ